MKFPFSIAIWNGEEEEEKEEENPTQRSDDDDPDRIVFRGRGEDQKTVRVKVLTREDFTLKVYDELSPTTNTLVDDERASAERERRTRALKNLSAERETSRRRASSSSSSSHHRFIKHNAKEKHQRERFIPL